MNERTKIIADGKERLEKTPEFRSKVEEIKKETRDQYSLILLKESNWAKRLWIRIKLNVEIKRRIAALSSDKNLHVLCRYGDV